MLDPNGTVFLLKQYGDKWGVHLANVEPKDSVRGLGDSPADALRALADSLGEEQDESSKAPQDNFVRSKGNSSTIASFGYDAAKRVLEVEFVSGATYHYYDVPQEVYDGMCDPFISQGQYFAKSVKGAFEYAKVAKPVL